MSVITRSSAGRNLSVHAGGPRGGCVPGVALATFLTHPLAVDRAWARDLWGAIDSSAEWWPLGRGREPGLAAMGLADEVGGEHPLLSLFGRVAHVPLFGPLTWGGSLVAWLLGGTPTDLAARAISAAAERAGPGGVEALLLEFDTPGGAVAGMSELVNSIGRAKRAGLRVIAAVHAAAYSAGYWAASQADEIVITGTGTVGSIGVMAPPIDDSSAAFRREGVTRHLVTSAELKGGGVDGVPVKPEQLEAVREHVLAMHALLVRDVAVGRGVSDETVEGWARLSPRVGAQAVEVGMADRVADFEEVVRELSEAPSRPASAPRRKAKKPKQPGAAAGGPAGVRAILAALCPGGKPLEADAAFAADCVLRRMSLNAALTARCLVACLCPDGEPSGEARVFALDCAARGVPVNTALSEWCAKLQAGDGDRETRGAVAVGAPAQTNKTESRRMTPEQLHRFEKEHPEEVKALKAKWAREREEDGDKIEEHSESEDSAARAWDQACHSLMAAEGLSRAEAVRELVRRRPALHRRLLGEANAGRPEARWRAG